MGSIVKTVELNDNMNKKELYVNPKNSDYLIDEVTKQFKTLEKQLNQIANSLNKIVYKKLVKNEDRSKMVSLSKRCNTQIQGLKKLVSSINTNYNEDKGEFAIKMLDDRIKVLEDKLEELRKDNVRG